MGKIIIPPGSPPLTFRLNSMNKPSEKTRIIFMVDDDEDDRKMFQEALQTVDAAAEFIQAEDGLIAINMLSSQQAFIPDLIFLDLNMPRKDGKQFLSEIRRIDPSRSIPVIVYTTSKNPRDIEEVKTLGAVQFITKPFFFDDICAAITCALAASWKTTKPGAGRVGG